MSEGICIDVDHRGLGTLGIPDAEGEVRSYRLRLVPRGLSLWAIEFVRADTEATYLVRVFATGKWECDCPAFTYKKRGERDCKHTLAARSFRAFLANLFQPPRDSENEQQRRAS